MVYTGPLRVFEQPSLPLSLACAPALLPQLRLFAHRPKAPSDEGAVTEGDWGRDFSLLVSLPPSRLTP